MRLYPLQNYRPFGNLGAVFLWAVFEQDYQDLLMDTIIPPKKMLKSAANAHLKNTNHER
jgi:hypothetical protein